MEAACREPDAGRRGRGFGPGLAGAGPPAGEAAGGWRRRLTVLAFLSPWLAGFCVFFGYPLVMTGYLSFTHYDLLNPPRWIGFANYSYLLHSDNQIWPAVYNTLWIIVIGVPLQVLFAFGIAVMLTRARRGVGIFRTIFYLPALIPPVAATLGFVYLLNPATGPVNVILEAPRYRGAALVQRPGLGEAVAPDARACGGSGTRWSSSLLQFSTSRNTSTSRRSSTAPGRFGASAG